MIDYLDQSKAWELSDRLIGFAQKYLEHRSKASESKIKFDLILASRMEELRGKKSNLGYETAQIMLLSSQEKETAQYYSDWQFHEAQYKGLEKVIESVQGKISLMQSLMKNTVKQGG
jgi:hypothetical protein